MTLITTTEGLVEEALLNKKEYSVEAPGELAAVTEYWLNDVLVHRSVHLTLNQSATSFGEARNLG